MWEVLSSLVEQAVLGTREGHWQGQVHLTHSSGAC